MSQLLSWIPGELQELIDAGLFRRRREVQPLSGGRCLIDGREVWDFASNDYLGLSNHPSVVTAAAEAVRTHGLGSKASALICGRTDLHAALERKLASFEGTEAAVLFPTGMAANTGTVAALASAGDVVFSDRLNHASLIDGCRASGAKVQIYNHRDLDAFRVSIARESARRKFIVTDSMFSMDGDYAPLSELCEIAESNDAAIIVDEAHATGVFGERGRGICERLGVEDRVAVRVGTLSKAVGTLGGFVSGSQPLIDYLWNKARTQIYSTALPPAVCAAAQAAIGAIETEPFRREQLLEMSRSFRNKLSQAGIDPMPGSIGPIVPIVLNEPEAAISVSNALLHDGFLVGAIRPPTVPKGTSRLRVSLHFGTSDEVIEKLVDRIAATVSRTQK